MHTLALVEFVCLCACVCISMCVYVCTFTRTFFKSHVTNVTSMCLTLSKYSHFFASVVEIISQTFFGCLRRECCEQHLPQEPTSPETALGCLWSTNTICHLLQFHFLQHFSIVKVIPQHQVIYTDCLGWAENLTQILTNFAFVPSPILWNL